ncbi:hypothetical protein AVW11_03910 [Streptomyces amritsarensis]|uniref:Uncharacterized protein n=1 Tax=Streptomyces amritsarensis TaxID=681158 RepID=A0ABX3G9C0_9ACTN|nr:hypothetical protein [Streptomyces amritsarensis]OLZ72546.1 hypothetical protein AVW11_03910 [Streptomyces amritsarensis]
MPGWHPNIDGRGITRHIEPDRWTDTWTVEGLTEQQKLRSTATHEAAHAVLMSLARVPVLSITVCTYSDLKYCDAGSMGAVDIGPYDTDLLQLCHALAAGERAEECLLRESGLWSVDRAWTVERHASSDRHEIATVIRKHSSQILTYGQSEDWNDLATIHRNTDATIARHWAPIRELADELVVHRQLTAERVQDITKIPNPAPPA